MSLKINIKKEVPLAERISATFPKLRAAAKNINQASDELAKAVSPIEPILARLNIGVATWTKISGDEDEEGAYWSRDVGYCKLNSGWKLAIRTTHGHNGYDQHSEETWEFNDAPRYIRVEAIGKIPQLLDDIAARAEQTTRQILAKSKQASEIVEALTAASSTADESDSES
jgi:hypothetical protein